MKVKRKKLVSLVLIIAMCFTLISAGAFAAEEPANQTPVPMPPLGLTTTGVSAVGAGDGTIQDMDSSIEYATDPSFADATEAPDDTLENLEPGDYYVRYKATETTPCSDAVKYIIADYGKSAVYFIAEEVKNGENTYPYSFRIPDYSGEKV